MEVFAEFRAYFTGRIIGLGSSDGCLVGNFYGLLGLVNCAILFDEITGVRAYYLAVRPHLFGEAFYAFGVLLDKVLNAHAKLVC